MKDQILKLRTEGKSYLEISKIVGCSKSTISYHCGVGQKEKTLKRKKENSTKAKYKIYSKIDSFISRGNCRNGFFKYIKRAEAHEQYYNKIINNPYCYLTGDKINLDDSKSYSLDHIIPFSKGGDNSIENMGLLSRNANNAKFDMSVNEFIILCNKIASYNKNRVVDY